MTVLPVSKDVYDIFEWEVKEIIEKNRGDSLELMKKFGKTQEIRVLRARSFIKTVKEIHELDFPKKIIQWYKDNSIEDSNDLHENGMFNYLVGEVSENIIQPDDIRFTCLIFGEAEITIGSISGTPRPPELIQILNIEGIQLNRISCKNWTEIESQLHDTWSYFKKMR